MNCAQLAYPRPGIVHRLDKETSGVMVVAKTESAYHNLVYQFSNRLVSKSYVALVLGRMKVQVAHLRNQLVGIQNSVKMAVVPNEGPHRLGTS